MDAVVTELVVVEGIMTFLTKDEVPITCLKTLHFPLWWLLTCLEGLHCSLFTANTGIVSAVLDSYSFTVLTIGRRGTQVEGRHRLLVVKNYFSFHVLLEA